MCERRRKREIWEILTFSFIFFFIDFVDICEFWISGKSEVKWENWESQGETLSWEWKKWMTSFRKWKRQWDSVTQWNNKIHPKFGLHLARATFCCLTVRKDEQIFFPFFLLFFSFIIRVFSFFSFRHWIFGNIIQYLFTYISCELGIEGGVAKVVLYLTSRNSRPAPPPPPPPPPCFYFFAPPQTYT